MNWNTGKVNRGRPHRPTGKRSFPFGTLIGVLLMVIFIVMGSIMLEKHPLVGLTSISIDSMACLKGQVVQKMMQPYVGSKLSFETIRTIRHELEHSGYFRSIRLELEMDLTLNLVLTEAEIIGTVMRDRLYYINRNGRLIPVNWWKDSLILPEYEGLVFDSGRVISVQSFREASAIMDYLNEDYPGVYKQIAKVYFDGKEDPYFLTRNRKLLRISTQTMKNNLGRFSVLYPELSHRDDFELIDLRFDNQIITKNKD
ncbi:MAG: cell division protein FtsQ/DivIB [Candidatus Delongbacteria bacterium]|nr:cell division protein FtsQ/DivIB [Candidatus Delongbacteria bacterium]